LPDVNRFLESKGLGAFRAWGVISFPGRYEIWAGPTTAGGGVFVKRISGEPESASRRLRRSLGFQQVHPGIATPRCLGWDEASRFVAFELVADARSGHDLADDSQFGDDLSRRMGALVGQLHRARHADLTLADSSLPELPPVEWLHGLRRRPMPIASVPVSVGDADDVELVPAHEQIVAACAAEIDRRRHCVRAFWHAYRTHAAVSDSGLAERAAGFAGWHVIDRVMAMAERRALIGAIDRAALGIARMVLLRPDSAAGLLGLEAAR
jgi:hypothetical protein